MADTNSTTSRTDLNFASSEFTSNQVDMAATWLASSILQSFPRQTTGCLRSLSSLRLGSPLDAAFWSWWAAYCTAFPRVDYYLQLSTQRQVACIDEVVRFGIERVDAVHARG